LFIGIELDDAARQSLAAAIERARSVSVLPKGLRVLDADTWHVTLQFLGNVAEDQLEVVRSALAKVAARAPAFEAQLSSAGAFPSTRRARVAWAGFGRGADAIAALAREVEQATRALGFTAEERDHHPHATWARARESADLRAALSAFTLEQILFVRTFALFRSHLSQGGARYEVLERFVLQG
jgi:2'-5' RNA ligase